MSPARRAPRQRVLWILRHAKALTDPPPGGSDHERELAPRGRRDARALGKRLGPKGDRLGFPVADLPTVVLCSTAARTTQTAERAVGAMEAAPEVDLLRRLYRADPDDMLEQVRLLDDDVRAAMVVGHNPTIAAFAAEMMAPLKVAGSVEEEGFPTCALAVVRLPATPWAEVSFGTATKARLFTPLY